jgi:NAD(P)-dependent dehydrogenase (short-subunit alcohol dehydrogenase family)
MSETILITGASRGLGLEFTRQFAEEGWHVIATCRSPHNAVMLKNLQQNYKHIDIFPLDVVDDNAITLLAEHLRSRPIDILLNNAGIFGPSGAHFGAVETSSWQYVFNVNTTAPLMMAQAFLPHLLQGKKKIIACMSSRMASLTENTEGGRYPYRTSKTALNMVVKLMSIELKEKNVISVALSPGWVSTDMGGENAPMKPELSASYLKKIMINLTLKDNGKFLSFDGRELPW